MADEDARLEQRLPDSWVHTTVGEIYHVVGGGTPSTGVEEYWKGDIPWITSADIQGPKDIKPRRAITKEAIQDSATNLVPAGSLIVVTRVGLGKVALTDKPLCFSQDSQALLGNENLIYPDYAIYYLSQAVQEFRYRSRGTTIAGVTKKQLLDLAFVLPPVSEQRRIVAEIETQSTRLEAGVAALKRAQANLRRYRASVLKAACEGRLVPTEAELARAEGPDYEPADVLLGRILVERRVKWEAEQWQKEVEKAKKKAAQAKRKAAGLPARIRDLTEDEWQGLSEQTYGNYLPENDKWKQRYDEPELPDTKGLPELPEGWAWATWNQISSWVTYGFTRPMPHVETGIPIVTAKNVYDRRVDFGNTHKTPVEEFAKLSDKDRPRVGDILVTKDGTIGRAAQVAYEGPFCINQSVAVVWLRSCPCDRRYLVATIEAPATQKQIAEEARGVALKHLSITDFARIAFPLPPLAAQRRIADEVERRLSVVEELEKQVDVALKRAERLRQAILKHAFEGKLVPQDPNDESASALLERIKAGQAGKAKRKSQAKEKVAEGEQLKLL